jgi:uncharacterized protein YtpQ (UPF0354 family)
MLKQLSRFFGGNRDMAAQFEISLSLPEADLALIVPMIKGAADPKPQSDRAEIQLSHEQSPVSHPFAADMVVMYAIDRPRHLEYVSNQVASASGLTVDRLRDLAVRNLASRLDNVQLHDCGEGVYGISAGGTFEASLLLMDDIWHNLAGYVPGEPLAAVPSRDLLFLVGSDAPNAERLIAAKAQIELVEKRYAVSQSVLIRRDGRWVAHAR